MADIAKLIYKKNALYGGESGAIKSSNNTYDDIVYLTQAEYDALPSKNPNTLYSTPEGESGAFEPSNQGTEGQVLTKTATGYNYQTNNSFSPQNSGEEGQVLTKTATGYNWENNGSVTPGFNTPFSMLVNKDYSEPWMYSNTKDRLVGYYSSSSGNIRTYNIFGGYTSKTLSLSNGSNGIAFVDGKMYVAENGTSTLYEVDYDTLTKTAIATLGGNGEYLIGYDGQYLCTLNRVSKKINKYSKTGTFVSEFSLDSSKTYIGGKAVCFEGGILLGVGPNTSATYVGEVLFYNNDGTQNTNISGTCPQYMGYLAYMGHLYVGGNAYDNSTYGRLYSICI